MKAAPTIRIVNIIFLALLCCLSACGGKGEKTSDYVSSQYSPLSQTYDNIVFDNFSTTTTLSHENPGMTSECCKRAMSELLSKHRYKEVVIKSASGRCTGSTLYVKGNITDMRLVSRSARFWGGAMAGSSYLNLTLTLIDGTTGKVVREERLSTANNPFGAAWTGGSTDKSLPADMGVMVANYIATVVPSSK